MLKANDKNDTTRILDDDCKIHMQKSKKLLKLDKPQNSQICIEFNDICYSVRHGFKGNAKMKIRGIISNDLDSTNVIQDMIPTLTLATSLKIKSMKNIYFVEIEKKILHDVTGHFETKKITIIIGPSGAGKSTLLKIISGKRLNNVKGTIIVNGVERNRGMFRKQICYVPQQYDLLPFLTTRETLYIAARLKLNINQSEQAIRFVVNDIAKSLGLSSCLNTLANKLSGGERKRLSIGVEMLTKPSILLLDEPTSGLDSVTSNQLISMLHDVMRANCTVVCAIHQPSSQMISLFDNIMVLNRGRCMYCGPKSEILNTYSIAGFTCPSFYNIAEYVLEVITEQRGGDLENLYEICRDEYEKFKSCSKRNKNELDSPNNFKQKFEMQNDTSINSTIQKKSTWQQQKILFLRALICIKRDSVLTKLRLAVHVVMALLLGALFYNFGNDAGKIYSNISCLFFYPFFLFFANLIPFIQIWGDRFDRECPIYRVIQINCRSIYVFLLKNWVENILSASCFLFISYYMTGQPMEYERILKVWSICLLITILGQTSGIFGGVVFGTELGMFLIPICSLPLLLFSGFFLKLNEMPTYLQSISFSSFFRFAYEGIMQAIYLDRPKLLCSEAYCHLRSSNKILSLMGMPTVPFYLTLIILGSWILCLHMIVYATLLWKIYYAKK
ncbi:ATP-binding cassette sub-family G member 4 [Acromyrmex echinatior]|uniref:ATP-binding cassette sub-family G member 4 n=2 Tax=Acromyrmex echinatior TaxID=103372 RepID=F4WD71_ACREC|nr:ATP-binding cassette sub-family G member 4 [Acromyrmex echinatior]